MTWWRNASGAGHPARRRAASCLAAAVLTLSGCGGSGSKQADTTYGALPSFLPSDAVQADSELVGSVSKPAVTSQGDSVKAEVGAGSVSIVVAGPEVPGVGLPNPPEGTTCTWTVSLHGATTAVPVDAADFTAIDHLGKLYRPALVPGQPVPPKSLLPGKTVSFELRAYMATGEGLMRWSPGGKATVASWDFVVETD
ncbi:MAG: hypothetical protein QOE24_98 [Frankiales bacterium]|nr:hypothetical protein [Frankiales bacterium]